MEDHHLWKESEAKYIIPYVYNQVMMKFTRTIQAKTIGYVHHSESHWNIQPVPFRHSFSAPAYAFTLFYILAKSGILST